MEDLNVYLEFYKNSHSHQSNNAAKGEKGSNMAAQPLLIALTFMQNKLMNMNYSVNS